MELLALDRSQRAPRPRTRIPSGESLLPKLAPTRKKHFGAPLPLVPKFSKKTTRKYRRHKKVAELLYELDRSEFLHLR
jgi:hypothetical protein